MPDEIRPAFRPDSDKSPEERRWERRCDEVAKEVRKKYR